MQFFGRGRAQEILVDQWIPFNTTDQSKEYLSSGKRWLFCVSSLPLEDKD